MTRPVTALFAACMIAALGSIVSVARSGESGGDAGRDAVERGRLLFEQVWSVAPAGIGRWGRGPTSNGEACTDCHVQNGRGALPASPYEPLRQGVLRLSQRVGSLLRPHPAYGDQLQHQGVLGKVPGEGEVFIEWSEHAMTLTDGLRVTLRRPVVQPAGLTYGELGADSVLSLRLAPALAGLGLLEDVSEATLRAHAAAQALRGVSGRIAIVTDPHSGEDRVGRFGHKATQPDLHAQAVSALYADLGVTSSRFPGHDCPPVQWECTAHAGRAHPEIGDGDIADLVHYLRAIPAPTSSEVNRGDLEGARLFTIAGCDACHVPALERDGTRGAVQAHTDLLLHDLGAGLGDERPEGDASGREWRTAPLWGLASHIAGGEPALLHDGRARTIAEAILWHDGEARAARHAFSAMNHVQRDALTAYVESR